jgi:hypothetical protein
VKYAKGNILPHLNLPKDPLVTNKHKDIKLVMGNIRSLFRVSAFIEVISEVDMYGLDIKEIQAMEMRRSSKRVKAVLNHYLILFHVKKSLRALDSIFNKLKKEQYSKSLCS